MSVLAGIFCSIILLGLGLVYRSAPPALDLRHCLLSMWVLPGTSFAHQACCSCTSPERMPGSLLPADGVPNLAAVETVDSEKVGIPVLTPR